MGVLGPAATLSLVLGVRGSAMLLRPGWERVAVGPAVRPAAQLGLPMGLDVEAGFAWAAERSTDQDRYAASVRLFWPITDRARPAVAEAVYGWEWTWFERSGEGSGWFGTVYGAGARLQPWPAVGARLTAMVRSDRRLVGGECLVSPACLFTDWFDDGRYVATAQADLVVSF